MNAVLRDADVVIVGGDAIGLLSDLCRASSCVMAQRCSTMASCRWATRHGESLEPQVSTQRCDWSWTQQRRAFDVRPWCRRDHRVSARPWRRGQFGVAAASGAPGSRTRSTARCIRRRTPPEREVSGRRCERRCDCGRWSVGRVAFADRSPTGAGLDRGSFARKSAQSGLGNSDVRYRADST